MSVYRFYVRNAGPMGTLDSISQTHFTYQLWKPSFFRLMPSGLTSFTFLVWWLFHRTHLFVNQEYGVILLRDNAGEIAHRSTVTPKYFRFPFMGNDDLQIGDVWTPERYRGKGLAFLALKEVLEAYASQKTKIWYLVEDTNIASIKLAEKLGFVLFGYGERNDFFGIKLLGKYVITSKTVDDKCIH